MEGKLIKLREDRYYITTDKQTDLCYHKKYREILKVKGVGEKSGEVHHEKGWNNSNEVVFIDTDLSNKLSLSNCQAIERGYDLDELVNEHIKSKIERIANIWQNRHVEESFKDGFQKALELMGDRKFTEDDIEKAFDQGYSYADEKLISRKHDEDCEYTYNALLQSLQQTEWEVVIETEDSFVKTDQVYVDEVGSGNYFEHNKICKLDNDGQIILKKL